MQQLVAKLVRVQNETRGPTSCLILVRRNPRVGSGIIRLKTRIGGGRETVGSFRGRNAVFYRCRARGVESSRCLSASLFVAEFTSFRAQPVNTTRVATARVTAVRRVVGAYARRNGDASCPVGQVGRLGKMCLCMMVLPPAGNDHSLNF